MSPPVTGTGLDLRHIRSETSGAYRSSFLVTNKASPMRTEGDGRDECLGKQQPQHKMADEVPENTGGIGANDRLADQGDTPMSPMLAAMHDRDETHQIRCAGLLTDLTAFCAGPGRPNFDEDAYNVICAIPGCSLEPVAVMIAHGAAVRRQLDEFASSQHVLQERLAQAKRKRDSLKSAADIAERVRQVGIKTAFMPPPSGNLGFGPFAAG
ncbi:hypothetical protein B484DRAFT_469171 [Ochromonadaceae sp. CCMP2298]|nr:hypothetical protein B484DRAFT_469171 [Ochromonadaceae sp. CCMP2298]